MGKPLASHCTDIESIALKLIRDNMKSNIQCQANNNKMSDVSSLITMVQFSRRHRDSPKIKFKLMLQVEHQYVFQDSTIDKRQFHLISSKSVT